MVDITIIDLFFILTLEIDLQKSRASKTLAEYSVFPRSYFTPILVAAIWVFNLWAPVVSIPLVAGVFGFRASTRSFFLSGAAGAITCLAWNHLLKGIVPLDGLAPGTLANFIAFSTFYMLENSNRQKLAQAPS